jgi:hypothetical protein
VELLHIALQSHQEALNLQQDNADALFNTAQVLTSLAEVMAGLKRPSEQQLREASQYLQEALELFQRCLILQELRYSESQEQIKEMEAGDLNAGNDLEESTESISSQPPQHDEWAAIVEPVTKSTLLDTAISQLETLSTLCSLLTLDPGSGIAWVEEYASDLLSTKLAAYTEGTDRHHEVALARAKFWSALTEVLYRSGRINIETYARELSSMFGADLDLTQDPEGLCDKAEALISFNTALAEVSPSAELKEFSTALTSRWQCLSSALDALTMASKLATVENAPKVHLARGDAEMYRWRLGRPPWKHTISQENASRLLQNAQTYYRGAAGFARRNDAADEEREAACKEALAAALDGQRDKLEALGSAKLNVLTVAEDMVEDGMVSLTEMEALLS